MNSDKPNTSAKSVSKKMSARAPPAAPFSRNTICKYVAGYYGPWLNLPVDSVEQIACANFYSLLPGQTHPGLLFDLVKVRRLVDEAIDLALRAQNGTIPSAMVNRGHKLSDISHGLVGRKGSGGSELSAGIRSRMRESAAKKLASAYQMDEVATSLATMEGVSALDSVASSVLLRSPHCVDAKYTNFFHEKIPAKTLAGHTSLENLGEVIVHYPTSTGPYRTRALVKAADGDIEGAIRDLTDAIALCKPEDVRIPIPKSHSTSEHHEIGNADKKKSSSQRKCTNRVVAEENRPSGLRMQLLFYRGNQYLELACRHVQPALAGLADTEEQYEQGLENREAIRKYAKKALRDYTSFLSQLLYACSAAHFLEGLDSGQCEQQNADSGQCDKQDKSSKGPHSRPRVSNLMMTRELSSLFSSSLPPPGFPPFPPPVATAGDEEPDYCEAVTYHPHTVDALHNFLMAHCLLQTPPIALLRHAYNVARVTRLCDGYPFFFPAASSACADWCEVLRRMNNWIGLKYSWKALCRRASREDEPAATDLREPTSSKSNTSTANLSESHGTVEMMIHMKRLMLKEVSPDVPLSEMRGSKSSSFSSNLEDFRLRALEQQQDMLVSKRAHIIATWLTEAPASSYPSNSVTKKQLKKRRAQKTSKAEISL